MARRRESIIDLLVEVPWWVSVALSALSYVVLTYAVPAIHLDHPVLNGIAISLPKIAPLLALFFLVPVPFSVLNRWRKRKLLDRQEDLESIRNLSWKKFEELVAEAYRRKGFLVTENHKAGADGGVDVRIEQNGHTHLVQCKQWKSRKIGVGVIREMFGLLTAEQATSAIIICSGIFTQEAKSFAEGKPIDLIDGSQLLTLVKSVQNTPEPADAPQPLHEKIREVIQKCPQCGSELILRTAKKGQNAGNQFYGCSAFPACRHIQSI